MRKIIAAIFAFAGYLAVCIIVGGFGFGSIVWLFGLFFNAGWTYLSVVIVVTIIYAILKLLNTLFLMSEDYLKEE